MKVDEQIETTRVITATVSLDDIKAVAIGAVKQHANIGEDADVVTTEAETDGNGGVVVKIVVKQQQPAQDRPNVDQAVTIDQAEAPALQPMQPGLLIPSVASIPQG